MEKCKYCGTVKVHTSECPTQQREAETTVEDVESVIDARLEEMILHKFEYFDEGNNGLILKFNLKDIPQETIDALREAGIELGDKQVTKVLKIYAAGKGEHEFKMQKLAHEMVEEAIASDDGRSYARVPRPLFFRDIPLSKAAAKKLKEFSPGMELQDRAQMIMMDMVDGVDLGKVFYREAHKRHPKNDQYPIHDRSSADDLQFAVSNLLGFEVSDKPAPGAGVTEAQRKLDMDNAKKLYDFLEKNDFRIHPAIHEQIRNTIALFHRNGLAFRDGHHRNFMVEGDYAVPSVGFGNSEYPQAFLIDFENSTTFTGELTDTVYERGLWEGGGSYNKDENILHALKPLTRELPERNPITGPQLKMLRDIESRRGTLRMLAARDRVKQSIERDNLYLSLTGNESDPEYMLLIFSSVVDMVDAGEINKDEALNYINKIKQKATYPSVLKVVTNFILAWK